MTLVETLPSQRPTPPKSEVLFRQETPITEQKRQEKSFANTAEFVNTVIKLGVADKKPKGVISKIIWEMILRK